MMPEAQWALKKEYAGRWWRLRSRPHSVCLSTFLVKEKVGGFIRIFCCCCYTLQAHKLSGGALPALDLTPPPPPPPVCFPLPCANSLPSLFNLLPTDRLSALCGPNHCVMIGVPQSTQDLKLETPLR